LRWTQSELKKDASEQSHVFRAILNLKKSVEVLGVTNGLKRVALDLGMIDFAHYNDPTGRREANIWKFFVQLRLSETRDGFNFLSALEINAFESEDDLDSDSDAVSALEPDRVNLMTVHASKGLEFDHVIVPNIHKAPYLRGSSTLITDDENKIWTIPIRDTQGSLTHNPLGVLKSEQSKKKLLDEGDRLLYVSLTRAKKSVMMTYEGKIQKNSWLSRLKWDLSEGTHKKEGFSYLVTSELSRYNWKSAQARKLEPIQILDNQAKTQKRVSVTSLAEKVSSREHEKSVPSVSKGSLLNKMRKVGAGTTFHKLLELKSRRPNLDIRSDLGALYGNSEDVAKAVDYLLELKSPPMLELVNTGFPEWGFMTCYNECVLEGQIDLWGTVNGEHWIIDYKTGSTDYKDKAMAQLRIYGDVIKKHTGSEKVHIAAVFPMEEKYFLETY
jgi:ATP-dependent helicase/nuclease subunit A